MPVTRLLPPPKGRKWCPKCVGYKTMCERCKEATINCMCFQNPNVQLLYKACKCDRCNGFGYIKIKKKVK